MDAPARLLAGFTQGLQKPSPIPVIVKNHLPLVPAGHHVVNRTRILNSQRTSHDQAIPPQSQLLVKTKLTIFLGPFQERLRAICQASEGMRHYSGGSKRTLAEAEVAFTVTIPAFQTERSLNYVSIINSGKVSVPVCWMDYTAERTLPLQCLKARRRKGTIRISSHLEETTMRL
jgi:hypothetical protein